MKFKKDCTAALLLLDRIERAGQLVRACGKGLSCGVEQERALRAQLDAASVVLTYLPPPQRMLLSLRYAEGMPPGMIRERLGYSHTGYYDAMARAIERVQTELEGIIG